jgi:hypothetical protein
LIDAPVRPLDSSRTGFEIRPEVFGYLALQVAHLVSEAALMLGTRLMLFDRVDHDRRPVTERQQRFGSRRRCGAEW